MELSEVLQSLVSDFKQRSKNKVASSAIFSILVYNYESVIRIAFMEKRTAKALILEINYAIFRQDTLWIILIGILLWNFCIPWINFKLKKYTHKILEPEILADLARQKSVEIAKKDFLDIKTGNAQKEELVAKLAEKDQQIDALSKGFESINQEKHELESKCENFDDLVNENRMLKSTLDESINELTNSQKLNTALSSEVEESHSMIIDLQSKISKFTNKSNEGGLTRLAGLDGNADIEQIRNRLTNTEAAAFKNQSENLEKSISIMKER